MELKFTAPSTRSGRDNIARILSFAKAPLAVLFVVLLPTVAWALPAFPGAEGMGGEAVGGRGGDVYIVDTLSDDPADGMTLREAATASSPRTIVFAVSGNIELDSILEVTSDHLTIARDGTDDEDSDTYTDLEEYLLMLGGYTESTAPGADAGVSGPADGGVGTVDGGAVDAAVGAMDADMDAPSDPGVDAGADASAGSSSGGCSLGANNNGTGAFGGILVGWVLLSLRRRR